MARLVGDRPVVAVERAIQELRDGRAVVVREGRAAVGVAAAEVLGAEAVAELAAELGEELGLILPVPRLRHLGVDASQVARVSLAGLPAATIADLFASADSKMPVASRRPASPLEAVAIDLVKRSLLVAAAVVMPSAVVEGALGVEAAAIANYQAQAASRLRIASRARVPLADCRMAEFVVFAGGGTPRDQVAIIVGNPDPAQPVLTRLHSACLTGDLFGSLKCDCGEQLRLAVQAMSAAGGGVLLYLDQEGRGIGLRNKMRAYDLQAHGHDTLDADAVLGYGPDERHYGVAARMLELLGFRRIVMLTNNPDKIRALAEVGVGVVVEGHQRLLGSANPHNLAYLATKAARAGHLLDNTPGLAGAALKAPSARSPRRSRQAL